jgi:hypothetical protein
MPHRVEGAPRPSSRRLMRPAAACKLWISFSGRRGGIGRRSRLKICRPQGCESSSLSAGKRRLHLQESHRTRFGVLTVRRRSGAGRLERSQARTGAEGEDRAGLRPEGATSSLPAGKVRLQPIESLHTLLRVLTVSTDRARGDLNGAKRGPEPKARTARGCDRREQLHVSRPVTLRLQPIESLHTLLRVLTVSTDRARGDLNGAKRGPEPKARTARGCDRREQLHVSPPVILAANAEST